MNYISVFDDKIYDRIIGYKNTRYSIITQHKRCSVDCALVVNAFVIFLALLSVESSIKSFPSDGDNQLIFNLKHKIFLLETVSIITNAAQLT
jgi:hypothetical protein